MFFSAVFLTTPANTEIDFRFLNVTVISGKGTLYGSLRVGMEESNFDFIIPSEGTLTNQAPGVTCENNHGSPPHQ